MMTAKERQTFIDKIREEVEQEIRDEFKEELRKAYKDALTKTFSTKPSSVALSLPAKTKRLRENPDDQFAMKTFNENKFFLGPVCAEKHEWQNSGKSLRYKSNHRCILCQKDYNRKRGEINALITAPGNYSVDQVRKLETLLEIDTNTHYLGNLCSKKHEFQNTGLSLRNKGSRKCIVCTKRYNDKYLKNKKKEEVQSNPQPPQEVIN